MPVGVQYPISSSLSKFSSYWDWLWCPSPFPSPSILGVFHSLLSAIGFQSCFFFTPTYHHPFGRPFTYSLLGEFPGLELALVPDVVVQRRNSSAHGAENSIQISALAGVEPRTLASRGR